ncbi:M24 family metallopeptidase [Geoglobus acetivorans]|uniref:Xaa-Pro peptidase family protein n=1 Tax=Geoglobus acetivorans TaxID=565033 RepID=A0ABZ3H6U9_GEOAI|nr:aminopeptidase P family protein [Geoglobus acetivorans]
MIFSLLKDRDAQFFIMYASSKNANFRYATKFWIPDPAFYMIGDDGTELLVVSEMEKRRAEKESRVREIASLNDLGFYEKIKEGKNAKDALTETYIELLKTHHARKILVPDDFPAFLYEKLAQNFDVEVVENPYADMRKVKTPEEIEHIKDVSNAIIGAFQFFLKLLEKERDSETLRNSVEAHLYERGYLAQDTIIAGKASSAYPHDIGHGRVEGHVIFDIFPGSKKTGYHSDFTRTVVIEKNQEIEDMLKACIEAKNTAISMVKEGINGEDIHFRVCDILESYGYRTTRQKSREGFIHSTGHGVGLEVHEKPRIFDGGEELKAGMVITVEPGLYYEKVGGVRVEDTVVVKKSGSEILTKFEDYVRLGR